MTHLEKVIKMTRPYWPRIAAGIVLGLMVSGITAAIAWLVKPALDEVLVGKNYEYLKYVPIGIVALFILKGVLNFCQTYLMKSAAMKMIRELRNRLFDHILYLPASYFNKESSGVIISRIINDVEVLDGLISHVIKNFVMELPTVIFLLGIAFYRSWKVTMMTLVLVPLIGLSTRKFGKSVKKKRKEAQKRISLVTHRIGEAIIGIRIIKVFNRESTVGDKYHNENQRYYREMMRVVRLKEFTMLVIEIITGLGIAFALWFGFLLIAKGELSPGALASILVAIYMIFSPIKKIGEAYTTYQETKASMERVDTILDTSHEASGNMKLDSFNNALKFDNVSFAYPGNASPVLKDINMEIIRGEVIAIVGQSGAGKSTLVDLIPRFHSPTKGTITIDGKNLNDIELHSLRELIGIVSQDIILFNDTIRENIGFGRRDAGEQEIIAAAQMAYADEFIRELPEQYDTVIGERGLRLSGGQRQRIAIARAILKNPPILVLDEATSSLDSVSEGLVQKALEKLMRGRTTVVIAHRLSTIKNADRIVIIEKGTIVDIGAHAHLISRNDTYKKLYHAFSLS
jgi:subfamily B ATP-binding cassette protein MsbA